MMQELSLNVLDVAENSVRAGATLIEITVEEDTAADLLAITIADNGKGMTEEQVRRVTDPFFTTRTTRRVGLGVPFFKMAAELSGGGLQIRSQPGKGTVVTARFGLGSIDRMPLGDMEGTIRTLVQGSPGIDFVYTRRLDGRELREWLAEGGSLELVGCYKRLRRSQGKADFMAIQAVRSEAGAVFARLVPKLARYGLRPERLAAYIHKERERPGSKRTTMQTLYTEWADYIEDAQLLGYDLSNPVFLTPKDLRKKHAATMVPAARLRDVKAGKAQAEKERARQKAVTARYCYSTDRWLIRAPVGPGEIAAEGAALRHCVGGYAGRHQNGLTTILFLRDRRRPGRPLATIEMQGAKLVQIHGFRNDRYAKVTPRERYAEILEPWLAWVAAGSKRDKKGRPRRPAQKKTSAA